MFEAKVAKNGGIVRRQKASVYRYASRELLLEYVKEYGYHLLEIGEHYVVICNRGKMEVLC